MLAAAVFLLASCGAPSPSPTAPAEGSEGPLIWAPELDTVDTPTWSLEELASAIELQLPGILEMNATVAHAAYDFAMTRGSATCPVVGLGSDAPDSMDASFDPNGTWWSDTCLALQTSVIPDLNSVGSSHNARQQLAALTEFDGHATDVTYVDQTGEQGTWSSREIRPMVEVSGEGFKFQSAGVLSSYTNAKSTQTLWTSEIRGTHRLQAQGVEQNWVTEGMGVELLIEYLSDVRGGHWIQVDGSIRDGSEPWRVTEFLDFAIDMGEESTCHIEPAGSIVLRDEAGRRYEILFDAPYHGEEDTGDCNGCGQATLDGQDLGSVCVDFGLLPNPENAPW